MDMAGKVSRSEVKVTTGPIKLTSNGGGIRVDGVASRLTDRIGSALKNHSDI